MLNLNSVSANVLAKFAPQGKVLLLEVVILDVMRHLASAETKDLFW